VKVLLKDVNHCITEASDRLYETIRRQSTDGITVELKGAHEHTYGISLPALDGTLGILAKTRLDYVRQYAPATSTSEDGGVA
jgi:hypothetical protein